MKNEWSVASEKKIFSLISIGTKAGLLTSGEFSTEKSIKEGKAKLVLLAEDASENTKKKFKNMCDFRQVPITVFGEKDRLGHAMGKESRASLSINDQGMAQAVLKHMKESRDNV